ncbi:NVEALA domain-containing protein [Parabacteroides sp. APC149_11_2_Y6]
MNMKKKFIKGTIAIIFLCCICFFYTSKKVSVNDLAFENIEALAQGESGVNVRCYGKGSVECHGHKVEKMYTGLSLD